MNTLDQKYLISIITPSHNTPDDLFKAAFDSVMAQTLDESLIEWVIVVHNSSLNMTSPRNSGKQYSEEKKREENTNH